MHGGIVDYHDLLFNRLQCLSLPLNFYHRLAVPVFVCICQGSQVTLTLLPTLFLSLIEPQCHFFLTVTEFILKQNKSLLILP